ncbi:hypothetical protein CTI12_AA602070 [Artemisia annua]|uniref:Transmembrane protein n=1 Tax=Artemisia annua TaxID=35608 RepID=A0A2U1KEE8_ARTAN|nr:hypothetical protein CTI12_AA602070 [Artemisia annua]
MESYFYYEWTDNICKFDTVLGIPDGFQDCMKTFSESLKRESDLEDKYSKPMPWIGIYIAVASLFCILAMVADLIHGFQNRRLWFPCKYFTLNAASLIVIAVAMKLPVDLNDPMPGNPDQIAKIGSMAFMCTMMANLLPSLATMNSKELLTNIIAFDILVITLIVNVCIQIYTGVIGANVGFGVTFYKGIALFYMAMLLILLIIHTCSGLTILKSKQIIELKYQAGHETSLKDLELQQPGKLTVEKLKQHVKNHWIMAGTGSPQFITACSATTSASGVICVVSTVIHVLMIAAQFIVQTSLLWNSDYKWSIPVILIIQFIGSLVGAIAPLCRCYAALSFKLSIKWIWNHIKVFKVESYWTQKLYDWKQRSIPFSVSSRKIKIVIQNFKVIFLIICIGLQKTVVVACKMIALIPIFFVICVLFCIRCWKWFIAMFASSIVMGQNPGKQASLNDLRRYVLQLQDDMELSERTLKSISKSVNHLIKNAEKQQPNNLMKLLRESKGFEGVGKYDSLYVPPLFAADYLDCWSLPLVTLTAVAVSLPKIQNHKVDRLLSSVSEGLTYVTLLEESLNATDKYVSTQKAAKVLWLEVEVSNKWVGNNLKNHTPEVNTAGFILQWFKNTAKNMVTEVQSTDNGRTDDNSIYRSICANSMYRITESILLSYHTNIDELSQEDLFTELSSMIADILAACLTNLPQVIVTKCHESVIEKRESSVNTTIQLLGETSQIINYLQDRELPDLDPAELPFIDKWRDYFNYPSP